ncbi:hypothetical protein F2Q70_00002261 [Brassica cretica]|uniref:Uncharacterized protein n=1 Tax=Brassica cretica TaxID=69181 RepID=A0A8S9INJ6_BRACR|nr:hypothetical protein F2Q70_00002261 [Brassica cretica]
MCFLGIPSDISNGIPRKEEIPRNYFRGLVSSSIRFRKPTSLEVMYKFLVEDISFTTMQGTAVVTYSG